jgi:glycosidase
MKIIVFTTLIFTFIAQAKHQFVYHERPIVYYIMIDRFASSNKVMPLLRSLNPFDYSEKINGGNFQGIINRLDYIQSLGVNSIMLSPVFESMGYHGYCIKDPLRIKSTFGTKKELQKLISEAHKRNIAVYLDIVINHICSDSLKYVNQNFDKNCFEGGSINRDYQVELKGIDKLPKHLRNPEYFTRCGYFTDSNENESHSYLYSDFSPRMFDLNTSSQKLTQHISSIYANWIKDLGVDGFRFDAARHVHNNFINQLFERLNRTYQDHGGEKLHIFAEYAFLYGNYKNKKAKEQNFIKNSKVNFINFPYVCGIYNLFKPFKQVGFPPNCGVTYTEFAAFIKNDSLYAKRIKNSLVYLSSHDWQRVWSRFNEKDAKQALTFMLLGPGIPMIYYGDEQGLSEKCSNDDCSRHALRRQAMFSGAPYRGNSIVESTNEISFFWNNIFSLFNQYDPYAKKSRIYNFIHNLISLRNKLKVSANFQDYKLTQNESYYIYESSKHLIVLGRSNNKLKLDHCSMIKTKTNELNGTVISNCVINYGDIYIIKKSSK